MIIQGMELRDKNRDKLSDVIPLDTPYGLYLEPTNHCNFECSFCPTGNIDVLNKINRPLGTMKWEQFTEIVRQLKQFPRPLRRINLYRDGEPLINKKFSFMVRELKQSGVTNAVWTKTNGLLLTPKLNEELVTCGLDMIGISIKHVNENGYKKVTNRDIDFYAFVSNIRDLFTKKNDTVSQLKIYISIADTGLSEDEIQTFYEVFEPISDYCAVEHLHGWSMSGIKDFTLGLEQQSFDGIPLIPKIVCPWPFHTFAINFQGTVLACNEDFAYNCVLGNVNNENIIDIWNGKPFFEFRKMLLEGRRIENKSCGNCSYLLCLPDNIDIEKEKILEKMENRRK
jgi:radical SAM protein with 4Fe4S-binding SPASM domain